jgi:molybdate transport system substrate-binding protein
VIRLALALSLLLGCRGDSESVTVAAAAVARAVAPALGDTFEATRGGRVVLLLGGSGTLADQVAAGAAVDVVLLADRADVDRLAAAGLLAADRRGAVAATRLVLVAARPAPKVTFESLSSLASNQSIAIGNPEHSASGVHARALFDRLRIWDDVRPRLLMRGDVAAALAAARRSQAAVAVVYEPDTRGLTDLEVLDRDETPVELWVALTRRGASRATARSFADFLRSDAARRLFDEYGFLPPGVGSR